LRIYFGIVAVEIKMGIKNGFQGFKKKLVKWLPLLLFFLTGVLIGWVIGSDWIHSDSESSKGYEIRQSGYSFTNPLLECEVARDIVESRELRPFKYKIKALIDDRINSKKALHISVYFRDLNNGPWFGISEKEEFSPASLQKVPIMIAYLKLAESDPKILAKKIKYDGNQDDNAKENIKPSVSLVKGKSYSIEELLYRMIVYSDNNAWGLLVLNIDINSLYRVFFDLGVTVPDVRKPNDYMTVKAYAAFFRILFNASYLNREMSEKALEYLTQVEFKEGLVGGLPQGIAIAHKFGERSLGSNNEIKQLHDCGIIYYPNRPYLLCVMSRGYDFTTLDDNIRNISYLVYEEIDSQARNKQ